MSLHHGVSAFKRTDPDIASLHRIVREWGSDDPEGKELARERLHAAQREQGIPMTPAALQQQRPNQPQPRP